jgi:hypothetical protein
LWVVVVGGWLVLFMKHSLRTIAHGVASCCWAAVLPAGHHRSPVSLATPADAARDPEHNTLMVRRIHRTTGSACAGMHRQRPHMGQRASDK